MTFYLYAHKGEFMLLGYDIGSSSVKVSIVDSKTKQVLGSAQFPEREMKIDSPKEGWAEQNPSDWWTNIQEVTDILFNKISIDRKKIKAIGISYQMHGLVAIDKQGDPVRPSIIWCDSRAVSIGEKAFNDIGQKYCLHNLLNSPGNFTASKLKWIQENEPENYKRIDKIMLPGDYIAYKLTGKISTTRSGMSEGIFWDFQKEEVSQILMEHFKFSSDLLPELVPTFSIQGKIKKDIAKTLGFNTDAVVAYRSGDQPNNAFALNVLEPGEIAATAGTSGVVYAIVDQLKFDIKNRVNSFIHVNHSKSKKRVGVLLCVNGTGSAYSWLRNNLIPDKSYDALEKMASTVDIGSDGLSFFPYGNGAERMLENKIIDAHFEQLQFNTHGISHMVRACIEGIAFSFVYGINCMNEIGLNPKVINVGNDNMFQSEIFATTIATLTNTKIQVKETHGAVGAALGAGYGAGIYKNLNEAFEQENIQHTILADKSNEKQYRTAYQKWLSSLNNKLAKA